MPNHENNNYLLQFNKKKTLFANSKLFGQYNMHKSVGELMSATASGLTMTVQILAV